MPTINMMSSAESVKGQGVGSAYHEQVALVSEGLREYEIMINKLKKCDITHYHTIDLKYYLYIPFTGNKGVNVGYVHFIPETLNGSIKIPKAFNAAFKKYVVSFYKKMDLLVVVNPCFIDKLVEYGIPREKMCYIPNFVSDKEFYKYNQEERTEARKSLDIPEDKFVILSSGQVQTRKGVNDFIEVAKKMPDKLFIWAGGFSFGKITDGYKELKEIIKDPPENVIFTGIVDREDMCKLYNIADMFFLPSFNELFPMTILEAFNCKLPVLLRNLEIYKDIFFDFYISGENVEDFVVQINKIEKDKEYREKASENSWRGHEMYCAEAVVKKWREFYGYALKQKEIKDD